VAVRVTDPLSQRDAPVAVGGEGGVPVTIRVAVLLVTGAQPAEEVIIRRKYIVPGFELNEAM
jgi:hypothetical protein